MDTTKEMKVFIVDDDQMQSEMLADHMSKYKIFKFFKYPTGEVCLQEMDKNPDIVILDYYLDRDVVFLDCSQFLNINLETSIPTYVYDHRLWISKMGAYSCRKTVPHCPVSA